MDAYLTCCVVLTLSRQSRTLKNTMYYRKIRNIAIVIVFVLVSSGALRTVL